MWPFIQYMINNTPSETLNNLSSSEAYFGRSLFNPISIKEIQSEHPRCYTEAVSNYLNELLPSLAKFQLDRQNKFLNLKSGNSPKLAPGDSVLMWMPRIDDGKLSKMWHGPLRVVRHYSASSYILEDPSSGTRYKRSIRQIRPLGRLLSKSLATEQSSSEALIKSKPENDPSHNFDFFKDLPYANTGIETFE